MSTEDYIKDLNGLLEPDRDFFSNKSAFTTVGMMSHCVQAASTAIIGIVIT